MQTVCAGGRRPIAVILARPTKEDFRNKRQDPRPFVPYVDFRSKENVTRPPSSGSLGDGGQGVRAGSGATGPGSTRSPVPAPPTGPPKGPGTATLVDESPLSPLKYFQERCASSKGDGSCYPAADCQRLGGVAIELCPGRKLQCCVFERSCGDVSGERLTYFQSPDYPAQSMGTLACDYDVAIQSDVCAVRIEYEKVQLARKLGGVCDIDQIFILNSVDGPTTGQCGPLSGYSNFDDLDFTATVAVNPGQTKPVKLAVLVQNEAYYHWRIKVMQIRCSQLRNFHAPGTCGRKDQDVSAAATEEFMETLPSLFHILQDVKWRRAHTSRTPGGVWWSFPEPVFNTFYYGTMKKHLQQQSSHSVHLVREAEERIVGGSDAELYEFPWQVAIFLEDLFFCGGALINDQFVLTAAHCLMTRDTPVESIVLQLGDHDLTTINETTHVTRRVRSVLFHSHFHPFLLANDIAMLRLDKPVALSYRVRPVCLPNPADSYTGRQGTVVGWGITSFPMGEPSPILQKLAVETLSNFQCARIIEEPVGLGMICAAPSSFQGTCFGDSGGPMTITEPDGTDVLVGLVSFGVTGCAVIPAFPDLYTRVSEYLKWIDVNAIT
ncbi:Serine protease lint [Gryllus bimaculatus]|nr:Serine protease lint [Gryllus bimaculatus]